MPKFWAILMVFIQLNYGLIASVSTGWIDALVSAESANSMGQSAKHQPCTSDEHSNGNAHEQSQEEAVENNFLETEFVDTTSFHSITDLAAQGADLSYCEYYLHHLPSVFADIDIPPPRA